MCVASKSEFVFVFSNVYGFFASLCLFSIIVVVFWFFFLLHFSSKHEHLASFCRHFVAESPKSFISIRFTVDWTLRRWLTSNLLRYEIFFQIHTYTNTNTHICMCIFYQLSAHSCAFASWTRQLLNTFQSICCIVYDVIWCWHAPLTNEGEIKQNKPQKI